MAKGEHARPVHSCLLPCRKRKAIYADRESDSFGVPPTAEHLLLCTEPRRKHLKTVFAVVGKPALHLCADDGFGVKATHQPRAEFDEIPTEIATGIQDLDAKLSELAVATCLWLLITPALRLVPEPHVALPRERPPREELTRRCTLRPQAEFAALPIGERVHLPEHLGSSLVDVDHGRLKRGQHNLAEPECRGLRDEGSRG
jgi:hypothetical protein